MARHKMHKVGVARPINPQPTPVVLKEMVREAPMAMEEAVDLMLAVTRQGEEEVVGSPMVVMV